MSRSVLTIIVFFFLVVLASSSHTVGGQEKGVAPPAPVPTQIFTAKNVFISNGGLDGIALQTFRKLGDVDQPYNAFYAAMKNGENTPLCFLRLRPTWFLKFDSKRRSTAINMFRAMRRNAT